MKIENVSLHTGGAFSLEPLFWGVSIFLLSSIHLGSSFRIFQQCMRVKLCFSTLAKSAAAATDLSASDMPLGLERIISAMYPENLLTSALMWSQRLIMDFWVLVGWLPHLELYLLSTRIQKASFLWPVLTTGSQLISSHDLQSILSSYAEKLVCLFLVAPTLEAEPLMEDSETSPTPTPCAASLRSIKKSPILHCSKENCSQHI